MEKTGEGEYHNLPGPKRILAHERAVDAALKMRLHMTHTHTLTHTQTQTHTHTHTHKYHVVNPTEEVDDHPSHPF